MRPLKTKGDLLDVMAELGACHEATRWVRAQRTRSVRVIWQRCPRHDWMLWLMKHKDERLAYAWRSFAMASVPWGPKLYDPYFVMSKRRADVLRRAWR